MLCCKKSEVLFSSLLFSQQRSVSLLSHPLPTTSHNDSSIYLNSLSFPNYYNTCASLPQDLDTGVHVNQKIMTSSTHDLTDNEADGQQQSESPMQPLSADGISHAGIGTQIVQYAAPPQLGTGHAMAPPAYPYPDPYYRSIFAPYDAQPYPQQPHPMVQLQLMGIQQAGVPLPTDAVEEPVFVNAKQYHGILRRRQSRAKAESENKAARNRKPYLHESRHLHALRRARGCGGRFLNSKKDENQQNEVASTDNSLSNINLNSDKNDLAPPSDKTS